MIFVYRQLYAMTFAAVKQSKSLTAVWDLPIEDISDMTVAVGMGIMMLNKMTDQILVCDAFMGAEHKRIEAFTAIENGKDRRYRRFIEDDLVDEGSTEKSHFSGTLKAPTKYIWKERNGTVQIAASLVLSSNQASMHYVEKGLGSQFRMPSMRTYPSR